MAEVGRNRQLMGREVTPAIPGIAAAGGVIATGSKGSAVAVQGSPPTMACGRGPELCSSARLFYTHMCQHRGGVMPQSHWNSSRNV